LMSCLKGLDPPLSTTSPSKRRGISEAINI
jgi:hypothetical protein